MSALLELLTYADNTWITVKALCLLFPAIVLTTVIIRGVIELDSGITHSNDWNGGTSSSVLFFLSTRADMF